MRKDNISGHGIYNELVEIDTTKKEAKEPHGECVIGTGISSDKSSIDDLISELHKLNTKKITVTLDCCRKVLRDAVIQLK